MKSMIAGTLPTVNIFDTTKANIAVPDDDRFANGWQYQDKAFCEYFNYFWNETSTSLTQMNPFVYNLNDEITQLVAYVKSLDSSVQFDSAENNWLTNVTKYLKGLVDTEATNRANADTSLSNTLIARIETETANRQSAISALETSLTEKLTAEATARESGDSTLSTKLGTYTNTGSIANSDLFRNTYPFTNSAIFNNSGYFTNSGTLQNIGYLYVKSSGSLEISSTVKATANQTLGAPVETSYKLSRGQTSVYNSGTLDVTMSGVGTAEEKELFGEYTGFQLILRTHKDPVSSSTSIPGFIVDRTFGIACIAVVKSSTNPSTISIVNSTDQKLDFQLLGGGSVQFSLKANEIKMISSGTSWWYRWYPSYS